MSPIPARLGIDVDEVVADTHSGWVRWLNDNFGLGRDPAHGIREWDEPIRLVGKVALEYFSPRIYDEDIVKPIDGALAAIDNFRQMGFDVWYVTSCINGTAESKRDWLSRHGFLPRLSRYLPMSDKSAAPVHILVDDHIKNVRSFKNGWAALVTRPHNERELWSGLRISHLADLFPYVR